MFYFAMFMAEYAVFLFIIDSSWYKYVINIKNLLLITKIAWVFAMCEDSEYESSIIALDIYVSLMLI